MPEPAPSTALDQRFVDLHGDLADKLMILVSVEGRGRGTAPRISERAGKRSADLVADLLRDADRSVA